MAGENVPSRLIAKNATLYVMKVATQVAASVYTETLIAALAVAANILGPARDVTVRDPMGETNQTAGGDIGEMVIHARHGVWEISIAALYEVGTAPSTLGGDSRIQSLKGQYVEFALVTDTGRHLCRGVGRFMIDDIGLPAQAADNIVRNIRIARWLPTAIGNLQWARGTDGTYVTETTT